MPYKENKVTTTITTSRKRNIMTSVVSYEKESIDALKTVAKIASESKQYANMTEAALLNLMLSARDLGISPMKAINGGFYLVNGKVCMSTAMMADRIRKAGHSIKITEMSRDKCVIIAVRKDNGDSLKFDYTWEDATLAGLIGSPTWKKFPKVMLYNRCMSSVARILFSDVVGNSYSEEERFDLQNIPSERRPLENPGEEGVLMIPDEIAQSNELTNEQCEELEALVSQDEEAVPKILKLLSIDNIYKVPASEFDRTIRWLNRRKDERAESSRTA